MTYTDSEAYVSDTISDAPGARTDAPGTPDAGETTDDGCESPILCAHPARCAPPVLREPAPPAELSRPVLCHPGHSGALRMQMTQRMVDEDGDVFDSQGRRFHGPALKANNIMRLLDYMWFRTECDHTLRTRLALHCRDCFDLVSKYLLALKAR
jgi:hypothetical protein